MKAEELRAKTDTELSEEMVKLRREQFNLRMQQATGLHAAVVRDYKIQPDLGKNQHDRAPPLAPVHLVSAHTHSIRRYHTPQERLPHHSPLSTVVAQTSLPHQLPGSTTTSVDSLATLVAESPLQHSTRQ